ncbi:MAG: hypothetical protein AAF223_23270, partial [Bacteroidota bacterium]
MRIIVLFAGFLICAQTLQAQDSLATYKKWSIGVKGGASFSFISASDEQPITRVRFSRRRQIVQGIAY